MVIDRLTEEDRQESLWTMMLSPVESCHISFPLLGYHSSLLLSHAPGWLLSGWPAYKTGPPEGLAGISGC